MGGIWDDSPTRCGITHRKHSSGQIAGGELWHLRVNCEANVLSSALSEYRGDGVLEEALPRAEHSDRVLADAEDNLAAVTRPQKGLAPSTDRHHPLFEKIVGLQPEIKG